MSVCSYIKINGGDIREKENIYYGTSVTSVAVAAHECGHALQHHDEYAPLKVRTAIVPADFTYLKSIAAPTKTKRNISAPFHSLLYFAASRFARTSSFCLTIFPWRRDGCGSVLTVLPADTTASSPLSANWEARTSPGSRSA